MSVEEGLLFSVEDRVATFMLNRPEQRNAFTDDMLQRWISLLAECQERDDVRVIVFAAVGSSFCAGADSGRLAANSQQSPIQSQRRMTENAHALVRQVARLSKPVIAAVNGAAVGGGVDLALMCDIRIAAKSARFAETYAKMGLLPGVGGAWFLPRIIGVAAALDMFWTGRWVDSDEALRLGLVNRVVDDEDLASAVRDYADSLAAAAPISVQAIKKLVYQGQTIVLDNHLDALAAQLAVIRTSSDHSEAVAAARERRRPNFTGT